MDGIYEIEVIGSYTGISGFQKFKSSFMLTVNPPEEKPEEEKEDEEEEEEQQKPDE